MSQLVQAAFRDAMRRLAATVTIISTERLGQRHGITATAVTSLSMDPPSLLVCVNSSGYLHAMLSEAPRFCVNLLRSEHSAVSDAFASKMAPEERFSHGQWETSDEGLPYLSDAQANIFCERKEAIRHGSHTIFIGSIESVLNADDVNPLIYSNGAYGRCTPLSLPG